MVRRPLLESARFDIPEGFHDIVAKAPPETRVELTQFIWEAMSNPLLISIIDVPIKEDEPEPQEEERVPAEGERLYKATPINLK